MIKPKFTKREFESEIKSVRFSISDKVFAFLAI